MVVVGRTRVADVGLRAWVANVMGAAVVFVMDGAIDSKNATDVLLGALLETVVLDTPSVVALV